MEEKPIESSENKPDELTQEAAGAADEDYDMGDDILDFSDLELDEPEEENESAVSEDEYEDGDDIDISGGELDEPEEENESVLSEDYDLDGDDIDITGGELAEPSDDDSDSSAGIESEDLPVAPKLVKRFSRQWLWGLAGAVICILVFGAYMIFKAESPDPTQKPLGPVWFKIGTSQTTASAAERVLKKKSAGFEGARINMRPHLVRLETFLVPVQQNPQVTCITLHISLSFMTKSLVKEIKKKEVRLRGLIYDVLRVWIQGGRSKPSVGELERAIERVVNRILINGRINEVNVEQWQAI